VGKVFLAMEPEAKYIAGLIQAAGEVHNRVPDLRTSVTDLINKPAI
jgi:hypothetical protein